MEATMAVNAAAAETMRQAEMFFTWMESVLDLEEQEEGDGEGDRVGMGPGVERTDMYGGHTISAGAETSVAAARVAATAFADDGHSAHAPTTGAGDVDGGGDIVGGGGLFARGVSPHGGIEHTAAAAAAQTAHHPRAFPLGTALREVEEAVRLVGPALRARRADIEVVARRWEREREQVGASAGVAAAAAAAATTAVPYATAGVAGVSTDGVGVGRGDVGDAAAAAAAEAGETLSRRAMRAAKALPSLARFKAEAAADAVGAIPAFTTSSFAAASVGPTSSDSPHAAGPGAVRGTLSVRSHRGGGGDGLEGLTFTTADPMARFPRGVEEALTARGAIFVGPTSSMSRQARDASSTANEYYPPGARMEVERDGSGGEQTRDEVGPTRDAASRRSDDAAGRDRGRGTAGAPVSKATEKRTAAAVATARGGRGTSTATAAAAAAAATAAAAEGVETAAGEISRLQIILCESEARLEATRSRAREYLARKVQGTFGRGSSDDRSHAGAGAAGKAGGVEDEDDAVVLGGRDGTGQMARCAPPTVHHGWDR
jgi:hypothetical protein